jgi:hypothetical protein
MDAAGCGYALTPDTMMRPTRKKYHVLFIPCPCVRYLCVSGVAAASEISSEPATLESSR